MKRLEDIKDRKKLETQGLEIHQNMLALFSDKYDAFAAGFESSETGSVGSSEQSINEIEAKKRFFDEIMRLKDQLDFSSQKNLLQVESELDKELSRSRSRLKTMVSSGSRRMGYEESPREGRHRLTSEALKKQEMDEQQAEYAESLSSHEPAD